MIPHTNADEIIAKELLTIDRSLWKTLTDIESICAEMFIKYIFDKPELADMCQEAIKTAEKEKKEIVNANKCKENTRLLNWTV